MFYKGSYRENIKYVLSYKAKSLDIWYVNVTSSSRPLTSLFKCPWCQNGTPECQILHIDNRSISRKHNLVFGMLHHLVV